MQEINLPTPLKWNISVYVVHYYSLTVNFFHLGFDIAHHLGLFHSENFPLIPFLYGTFSSSSLFSFPAYQTPSARTSSLPVVIFRPVCFPLAMVCHGFSMLHLFIRASEHFTQ